MTARLGPFIILLSILSHHSSHGVIDCRDGPSLTGYWKVDSLAGEHCLKDDFDSNCNYEIRPLSKNLGAEVLGLKLPQIDIHCAKALKQEAYMYRYLLFRNQHLGWKDQIEFTEKLGTPFQDGASKNRPVDKRLPDTRIGFFSNDPKEGLGGQGTEGWHVDGNVVHSPHQFTLINSVSAIKNGPTLIVPIREIVDSFSKEDREFLESIDFVSAFEKTVRNPLIYRHPIRKDETMLIALGRLSGQYIQRLDSGAEKELSVEETQAVQDLIEAKIMASNKIVAHQYQDGDLLMLENPSVAHLAGPGSQTSHEIAGLRLMYRTTVKGETRPTKRLDKDFFICENIPPFNEGYCYFSLAETIFFPEYGRFETTPEARKRCQNIHADSDLALVPNEDWNRVATKIVLEKHLPHWINATNPEGEIVLWNNEPAEYINWESEITGQPNDSSGVIEVCIFIGPGGKWFDLTCGPKNAPGADLAPVIPWDESGQRYKLNVFPLCGVKQEFAKSLYN